MIMERRDFYGISDTYISEEDQRIQGTEEWEPESERKINTGKLKDEIPGVADRFGDFCK